MLEVDSEITCDDESLGSEMLMDIVRIGVKESEWIPFVSCGPFDDPVSECDIVRIETGEWTMMSLGNEIGNHGNFLFRY